MPRLVRQGVGLCYDEAGTGQPPLLLVHGVMNDRSYFAPQLEHFGRRCRTVAVDLRGHGQSDKPENEYTIHSLADDLHWLCQQLSLARPIVVGHSMGGVVALELAARGLASGIVILDAPILPPEAFAVALQPFIQAMQTPQYREAIRQFLSQFVGFADQPKQRERLIDEMSSVPQHVIASAMLNLALYDAATAASANKAPTLYVSAGFWFTQVDRFRELCPQLATAQTFGSGHYHQLEVPAQINAMIERFITITSGSQH